MCGLLFHSDTAKEKSGGLSFDLILQPAVVTNPPAILRRSFPSMKSSISQEEIEKKLCEAKERRKVDCGYLAIILYIIIIIIMLKMSALSPFIENTACCNNERNISYNSNFSIFTLMDNIL